VSKGGHDATGVVERIDLPFQTPEAARLAALALYVGVNAPSATNRIMGVTLSGTYENKITLDNYFDWDLTNAVLDYKTGGEATLDDSRIVSCNTNIASTTVTSSNQFSENDIGASISGTGIIGGSIIVSFVDSSTITISNPATATGNNQLTILKACDSAIYGGSKIHRSTASTGSTNSVRLQNAASILTVYSKEISSSLGPAASIEDGKFEGGSALRIKTTFTNANAMDKSGGTVILNSNTLIANGTGKSIYAPAPQDVLLYGANQQKKQ